MNGHIWLTYMPQFCLPSKRIWFYYRKCIKKLPKWERGFLLKSSPYEFEDIYKIKNLQVLVSSSGTPSYQISLKLDYYSRSHGRFSMRIWKSYLHAVIVIKIFLVGYEKN